MPQKECQYCWGRGEVLKKASWSGRMVKCPRCGGRGKVVVKKQK